MSEQLQNDADGQVILIGGIKYQVTDPDWNICQNMSKGFQQFTVNATPQFSGFRFGPASLRNFSSVYPPLVLLASHALLISTQDFGVTDGLRTPEEQRKNVAKGVSRTQHSMHLMQADDYAHAIDCVPFHGAYSWDWNRIYDVAAAMHTAASICGVASQIRWGGAWDRRLSDFGDQPTDFEKGVKAYAVRHQGSDLLDGPHFEWVMG